MSSKKMLKAQKPTDRDKDVKAKRTGYRFKTEGVEALHKKDGSLNKKGESLYYKKPSASEIEKYKKNPDGSYPDKTKEIYHERRADRKHSDDNLIKKFSGGGAVKIKNISDLEAFWDDKKNKDTKIYFVQIDGNYPDESDMEYEVGSQSLEDFKNYRYWEIEMGAKTKAEAIKLANDLANKHGKNAIIVDLKEEYKNGGAVKQNPAQSEHYSKSKDKLEKAKPVGMRFTDKLAKKLHKSPNATPTKKEIEKYLGDGVYDEKRKDKSDVSLKKKFKGGGTVKQNPAQSEHYSKSKDKLEKAKPVGMRYTNELADELGKSHNATPTKKDVEEYLGDGIYDEKRKDKSDVSLSKKYEEGGEAEKEIRMSVEEMKIALGRKPKYPRDYINGKKYEKCFLIPFYRLID